MLIEGSPLPQVAITNLDVHLSSFCIYGDGSVAWIPNRFALCGNIARAAPRWPVRDATGSAVVAGRFGGLPVGHFRRCGAFSRSVRVYLISGNVNIRTEILDEIDIIL